MDVDINYPDYPDYPGYIYPEPDYSHITLPDESCDDDEMYDAVQNVLNKLRNFRYNEFYYLASAYQPSGINIESTEDVRRVACFMSGRRADVVMAGIVCIELDQIPLNV